MHPEYAAVNGSGEDKYSRPRVHRVTWWDDENELHEIDLRDRELALRIAASKLGTVRTTSA
jgi:hypothetical protein